MPHKTTTIRQTVLIPASPQEVYEAFVDAKRHSAFTGAAAACDPVVGGAFSAWDGYITGRNLKLTYGKRIVQEWRTTEWPEGYPPSRFEFSFRRKGNGTQVTVVHSRVPAGQAKMYGQGWKDAYWEPLKAYFRKK